MNGKTVKTSFTVALSLLFVITSLYSYWDCLSQFYYMTFLGNFLTGAFLLIAAILYICDKQVPQYLILSFTVLMLLILGVTVVTQDFYIQSGFLFLYFLNPALMLVYFLLFSNQINVKLPFVLGSLVMPFLYMIFAFIRGACIGDYIYYYLDFNSFGAGNTALFIFGILTGLLSFGVGLYYLNRAIHKRFLKDI